MAIKNGVNNTTAYQTEPSDKIQAGEYNGRVRRSYDSYVFGAAEELAAADVIRFMKLPANAQLVDARIISPDWGATGSANIGWEASADGSEVADPDGMYAALDTNAAAVDAKMGGTLPGYNKKFSREVQVSLTAVAASTALAGLTIELEVLYIID